MFGVWRVEYFAVKAFNGLWEIAFHCENGKGQTQTHLCKNINKDKSGMLETPKPIKDAIDVSRQHSQYFKCATADSGDHSLAT